MTNADHWAAMMRRCREQRGLTRATLASRAGVSTSAIKAFETQRRHPREATLNALIDALGLTREEANPIRVAAGYSVDWYSLLYTRYPSEALDLRAEVAKYPFPAFVTNQAFDLIHANRAFELVIGVDLTTEFLAPGERNFLVRAGDPRFTSSFENLDELLLYIIGLVKGDPRWSQSPERPAPWLQDAVARLQGGNPSLVRRVFELWSQALPIPHRARHAYRVHWRRGGSRVMRFICSTSIADLWNELSWNEWVPEDAMTWQELEKLTAG